MSDPIDALMRAMDDYIAARECYHEASRDYDYRQGGDPRPVESAEKAAEDAMHEARDRIRSSLLRAVMPEEQGE